MSKLTFGELDYMVMLAMGTFDEFFDGRWGKENNKKYPDQLRHDIVE